MGNHTRGVIALFAAAVLAACGGSANESSLEASTAEHQFACDGFTPGFWCGGASPLFTNKSGETFCADFGLPAGCEEGVCMSFGYASCSELCQCFQGANASPNSNLAACNAGGGMSEVLEKFWVALQLSFPEVMNGGGIECVDAYGDEACDGGFPDCNSAEIQTLIGYGNDPAWRDEQETVKNCIDAILNDGGVCVSAL